MNFGKILESFTGSGHDEEVAVLDNEVKHAPTLAELDKRMQEIEARIETITKELNELSKQNLLEGNELDIDKRDSLMKELENLKTERDTVTAMMITTKN